METESLIFYLREDVPSTKRSQVHLLEVDNAGGLRDLLAEAMGVLVVVEKLRSVYRWGEVQIHLDEVDGLGEFLEFERVIASEEEGRRAEAEFTHLKTAMRIDEGEIVGNSYSDLILSKGSKG